MAEKHTVYAVKGEIVKVTIDADTQEEAEKLVLADPRIVIIIDKGELEPKGEDPKDPVPKVH